jgi:hypothetical protein
MNPEVKPGSNTVDLSTVTDRRLADNVLLGKDGYIFLRNDRNKTIPQITGKFTLTGRLLRAWGTLFDLRKSWFEQRGIDYFYISAPCKECVYRDYLPEEIQVSEDRPLMKLKKHLERLGADDIIYPLDELISSNNSRPTYPRGDSHWNWYGAFVGYHALMGKVNARRAESGKAQLPVLSEEDVEFSDVSMDSDLSIKIGLTDIVTNGTVRAPKARCVKSNNISNIGNYKIFENENKNLPRAVLFRDSFSNYTVNFLAESFSRLVVVWQPNIDYSIVKSENPDIVISQQAERFMVVVPDELGGSTNRGYVSGKVESGLATRDQAKIVDL